MSRRLIICRHTLTDHNLRGIYSGQLDAPLNGTGRSQADALATRVASLGDICGVVGSDLSRTAYLAEGIGTLSGVGFRLTRDLREVSLGLLEGRTKAEFPTIYRSPRFDTYNPHFDFTQAGGESADQVIERYMRALKRAHRFFEIADGAGRTTRVVIVGHGTALRLVFKEYLGLIEELHEQGGYQEIPWR